MYLFSRAYFAELGYDRQSKELLQAKAVGLRVLAPFHFYERFKKKTPNRLFDLQWIEKEIPAGFKEFLTKRRCLSPDLIEDFKFEAFPVNFVWNPAAPDQIMVADALHNRTYIYS